MKQFEDIPVWQAGRELAKRVYGVTRREPFARDWGLCDQIQRAAVSVSSNIAEGHERGTTPDLIQFLFYAKGSAGEVRSQLSIAQDLGYVAAEQADELRELCRTIGRQLSAWIRSMQTPGFGRGPARHREPDRAWERFLEKAGMERLPNGQFRVRQTEERKTEDGMEEEGMEEEGIQEEGK